MCFLNRRTLKYILKLFFILLKACNRNNIDATYKEESTNLLIQKYVGFQEQVRKGHLGNTARFWILFMDNAKLIFMLIYAVKTNSRKLFHKCNGEMANLHFVYDGQNYCRLVIIKSEFIQSRTIWEGSVCLSH